MVILVSVAAAVFAYSLATALASEPAAVRRLGSLGRPGGPCPAGEEAAGQPGEKTLRRFAGALRRIVPRRFVEGLASVEVEVAAALAPTGLDFVDVHLMAVGASVLVCLFLVLALLARGLLAPGWLIIFILASGVGAARVWVNGRVARHRAAVARELPKVADLLTLGTESGLELLSATDMASRLSPGPVGTALRIALDEANAGREIVSALRAVPARVGGRGISSFIASVVQGLELGTPVARVLRVQADGLRAKRRQALEAKIAGLSMKLTLITVLLFVPALLVIAVLPNLLAFLGGSW